MQEAGGVLGSCLRERRAWILPARAACSDPACARRMCLHGLQLTNCCLLAQPRKKLYISYAHTCMCMYTHTHTRTHTHQAAASTPGHEDANLMTAAISFFVLLGTIGYWMFLRSKKEAARAEFSAINKVDR